MQDRRTMRKLVLLHQILNTKKPAYLYKIVERQLNSSQRLINRLEFKNFKSNSAKFTKSFFPSTIIDWNNLDIELRSAPNSKILKNRILNKIRPKKALYVDTKDNDKVRLGGSEGVALLEKITSTACLVILGLKTSFHCQAHCEMFCKSLFKISVEN